MHPESGFRIAPDWPMTMTSQYAEISIFWRYFVSLVNFSSGANFMSILSLVLKLWQFTVIRDWPETRQSEIPPSEFCQIFGDWGELWIPNLARVSLMKCYWMLPNDRVTTFTISELLRENQQGGDNITPSPTPRLGLNWEMKTQLFIINKNSNFKHHVLIY